jgi:acetyl-CoA carboxylase carboxyltransferase component
MVGKLKNPIFAYSTGMSGTAHKVENASLKEVVNVYLADAARAEQGGGPSGVERQHKNKRLTARERLELLLDAGAPQM